MNHYHLLISTWNKPSILLLDPAWLLKNKILDLSSEYPRIARKGLKVKEIYKPIDSRLSYEDARCWILDWLIKHAVEGDVLSGVFGNFKWRHGAAAIVKESTYTRYHTSNELNCGVIMPVTRKTWT